MLYPLILATFGTISTAPMGPYICLWNHEMVGKHITSNHTSEVQLLDVHFRGFPPPPTNHPYVITCGIACDQLTLRLLFVNDYCSYSVKLTLKNFDK